MAKPIQPRQKLCAQVRLVVGSTKGILKGGSEERGRLKARGED